MKKKIFAIVIISTVIVLSVKFVETSNLKNSDAFGAGNVYTDNKSFVNSLMGYDIAESKWFGEFFVQALVGMTLAVEKV